MIGNAAMPFLNQLASNNALAAQYFANAHPAVLGRRHVPWDTDITISCGGATVQPGDIIVADADGILVVRTRRGDVRVPRSEVTALKEIPPSPSRRGKPHRALSVEDLQRVMVDAWPAMETARLGDWLLRASRGFTQRANSVNDGRLPYMSRPTR